jgi:hypothetical protein
VTVSLSLPLIGPLQVHSSPNVNFRQRLRSHPRARDADQEIGKLRDNLKLRLELQSGGRLTRATLETSTSSAARNTRPPSAMGRQWIRRDYLATASAHLDWEVSISHLPWALCFLFSFCPNHPSSQLPLVPLCSLFHVGYHKITCK